MGYREGVIHQRREERLMAQSVPAQMYGLRVHAREAPEVRYEQIALPEPGIGDVLVEVAAASFTPTELEWPSTWVDRAGRDRAPIVPAHEVSGTVVALGYGTTGLQVGDEVYGITDWYRDGAAAEFVAVEARNLALKPSSVAYREAAALSLAGLTAWQALFVHGRLRQDQSVVITGASGGVGTLAVQLARDAGARVIAVAHDWARSLLGDLGAQEFIDAQDPKASEVHDADLIVDLVGGDLAARCSTMAARGGTVVSVVESEPDAPLGGAALFFVVEADRGQLIELARLCDTGRIRPVVGKVIDMAVDGGQAFTVKQRGGVPGKIVLEQKRG
jgi:NADPH:quinone reductase-like Zn-dependent oxidoreductase